MIAQAGSTVAPSTEIKTSVIINISTPGTPTPICRIGNSEEILGSLTVGDLVDRIVSPKSLFSVGIPMSQLEAESPTALAISELLSTHSSQVMLYGSANEEIRVVARDEPARAVAQLHTGAQGTAFLDLNLNVRPLSDNTPPAGEERRQVALPEVAEEPVARAQDIFPAPRPLVVTAPAPEPTPLSEPVKAASAEDEKSTERTPASPPAAREGIMTIVAQAPPKSADATAPTWDRKEYLRKSDWLRAQFQPEVEALNFTGLFVGNLGLGIREEQGRRQVVLADPARVTDILLRGNGYRRSGDHAKALICYQELVDMDPGNADFRFLLGKTLLELNQHDSGAEAFARAKELGHEGAAKELDTLRRSGARSRHPLGFLKFWKQ
jgi:hypothetical protein